MSLLPNLAIVALGGAIGSCMRYGLGLIEAFSTTKGLSTFIVNVLGCFIIGVMYSLFAKWQIGDQWRLLIFIGVLGGFTTFSTYSLDVVTMMRGGEWAKALAYVGATNIGGFVATAIGIWTTNLIIKSA